MLSARRRLALLDWARQAGAWIIEDDYDSEFRYACAPIASLQGLDPDARVLYFGTFSKSLFPALRMGYLVIPEDLVEAFARARNTLDIAPAPLMQAALASFLREGHFARHLRQMRILYRERRAAMVAALGEAFGPEVEILSEEAGMHLTLALPEGVDDLEVSRRAAQKGIAAMPLSRCYRGSRRRSGLVLGYASVDEARIREGVEVLRAAVRSTRAS
jgi:GntR family transcriptional regulator/MocR family aminotransferase